MNKIFFNSPFDLLFRDFFADDNQFSPAIEAKIPYPVDIYEDKDGLYFELACTGIPKKLISISIEGDILRISYNKPEEEERTYIHKGIAKRSFNLGYKISPKFDLSQSEANLDKGLLKISIPFSKASKPKSLEIKD